MEVLMAIPRLYASDESNRDLLGLLDNHLESAEKRFEAVMRMASKRPLEQQDEYWAFAKDLQKEIRLTPQRTSRDSRNPNTSKP